MTNTKKQNAKHEKLLPDSIEVLQDKHEDFWLRLNEGTEDENVLTLGQYVRACEELDKEFIDEILTIGYFAIDESKWIEHDFVRRIKPPVNNYQSLVDALKNLVDDIEFNKKDIPSGCIGERQLRNAKTALNNTKEL